MVCVWGMLFDVPQAMLCSWMPSLPACKGTISELGMRPVLVTVLCGFGKVKPSLGPVFLPLYNQVALPAAVLESTEANNILTCVSVRGFSSNSRSSSYRLNPECGNQDTFDGSLRNSD